jgi:hypothetical protein
MLEVVLCLHIYSVQINLAMEYSKGKLSDLVVRGAAEVYSVFS